MSSKIYGVKSTYGLNAPIYQYNHNGDHILAAKNPESTKTIPGSAFGFQSAIFKGAVYYKSRSAACKWIAKVKLDTMQIEKVIRILINF